MYRVIILVLLFVLSARFAYWLGVSNKDNNWMNCKRVFFSFLYLLMFSLLIAIRYPSGLLKQAITFSSQNKLDVAFLVGIMCPVALTIFDVVIFHINKWIEKQVNKSTNSAIE